MHLQITKNNTLEYVEGTVSPLRLLHMLIQKKIVSKHFCWCSPQYIALATFKPLLFPTKMNCSFLTVLKNTQNFFYQNKVGPNVHWIYNILSDKRPLCKYFPCVNLQKVWGHVPKAYIVKRNYKLVLFIFGNILNLIWCYITHFFVF